MLKLFLTSLLLLNFTNPVFAADKESAYDRVMKTGTIRCGYGISPPALVKDPNTGKLSGADYDVWEAVGRNLDVKIEWVESSGWGNFIQDLRSNRYDAFCSQMWMTPERSKFLSSTLPVAYTFVDAYVLPEDTRFDKGLATINSAGVSIPVLDGDITEFMAKSRFPDAKRVSMPNSATWAELYMSVADKKADVFFIDPTSYKAVAANNTIKLKKINTTPVFTFGSYYGVAQGEYGLRDMVNVALQMMLDSGQLEQLIHKTEPLVTIPSKNYVMQKPEMNR